MSEIEIADRRSRATQAGYDLFEQGEQFPPNSCLETVAEVATQVKITPEMIERVRACGGILWQHEAENVIAVALSAAGFEVIP